MLGCMRVTPQVSKINDFEWQKQLRYYWDVDVDDCIVRMSNSVYHYGYEYLGASPRLVITPLTVSTFYLSGSLLPVCHWWFVCQDHCYLCVIDLFVRIVATCV